MANKGISFFVTKDTENIFLLDKSNNAIIIDKSNFNKEQIVKQAKKFVNNTYVNRYSDELQMKYNAKESVWFSIDYFMEQVSWEAMQIEFNLLLKYKKML